jgi:hypothetical protein
MTTLKRDLQPDVSEIPTSLANFIDGTDPLKKVKITLFEIKDIPRKGKSLVACFNIFSGTHILYKEPLLTV